MTKEQYRYWLKGYLSDKLSQTQIATITNTLDQLGDYGTLQSLQSIGERVSPPSGTFPQYYPPQTSPNTEKNPSWDGQVYCGTGASL